MDEIIGVIGEKAAQILVREFGGSDLYVPTEKNMPSHPIAKLIGPELAIKLSRWTGGTPIYIPLQRALIIVEFRQDGVSVVEIARRLSISERTVRRHLAEDKRKTDPVG